MKPPIPQPLSSTNCHNSLTTTVITTCWTGCHSHINISQPPTTVLATCPGHLLKCLPQPSAMTSCVCTSVTPWLNIFHNYSICRNLMLHMATVYMYSTLVRRYPYTPSNLPCLFPLTNLPYVQKSKNQGCILFIGKYPPPPRKGRNICQCHLGKKYEKGK